MRILSLSLCVSLWSVAAFGASSTFVSSGSSPTDIQTAVTDFNTALGRLNPNTATNFNSGRKAINWDGVPDASSAPNALAANFFNVSSPRGIVMSTPGTGFQTSATVASGTAVRFGNINPTYSSTFQAFTPQRLFTAVGSNIVDVSFFVPGTTRPATTTGFGAVFTDVDVASVTRLTFFDVSGTSLGTFDVPASPSGGLSFLGVLFDTEDIARVRITSGNTSLGAGVNDNNSSIDLVVMDDFIYGEPQPVGKSGDANGDGVVTVADVLYLVNFLYAGGAAPQAGVPEEQ